MAGPQVRGYLRIQASIKVAATSFHEAVPIGRKLAAKVLIHPGPSAPVNAGETKGACVYGIGNWKKTLRNAYHSFSVKHQATVCLCVGGQEASCCRGIWGQLCVFNPALVLHCVCASTGLDGRFLILNKPPPPTTTTNFSSSSSSLYVMKHTLHKNPSSLWSVDVDAKSKDTNHVHLFGLNDMCRSIQPTQFIRTRKSCCSYWVLQQSNICVCVFAVTELRPVFEMTLCAAQLDLVPVHVYVWGGGMTGRNIPLTSWLVKD